MPFKLVDAPAQPAVQDPPRKLWTRAEMEAVESTGVWNGQHLELIEGELISKKPQNRPHVICLVLLQAWLQQVFGIRLVNPEAPIDMAPEDNPTSVPEPDIIVLNRDSVEIRTNPQPRELQLVVEIADSSVQFDLGVKARLYARAGIPEYWVADIPARRLIVHRDPAQGQYNSRAAYAEQESVAPLASPHSLLKIADVLPPIA